MIDSEIHDRRGPGEAGRPPRRVSISILLAWCYAAASVGIGPLIVFGLGGHESGFDCSDLTWGDASLAERNATYQDLKANVIPPTIFMIAIGVAALVALVAKRKKSSRVAWILPAVAVVWMLAGYGSILALADWLWGCTNL